MVKLLAIFLIAVFLAYQSEKYTRAAAAYGYTDSPRNDKALIMLIIALTLFAGLRTQYNDTTAYINGFENAPGLREFFTDISNLNPFTNPLFYLYQSFLKSIGCSAQMLIFTTALFTQTCFILFFKRYSSDFPFSVFIYFTLGTFCVSLAAVKQVAAMAMLTQAMPYLEKKNWKKFYLIVIIAGLVHTYALTFAILPFFAARPWKSMTYLLLGGTVLVLYNFREVISGFMDEANELGKTLADYEVFDGHTVNALRILVYLVPPLISFVFRKWLYKDSSPMENVLVHMSVISLCFMLMGSQAGANMFARMAHYFEIGTICILPWLVQKPFVRDSYRVIVSVAVLCFGVFFIYAYGINMNFDTEYRSLKIFESMLEY
ncbi:MAG: EpsG family protein [Clostridia bacterium]|nr:EpsG family protein [Clostridia bacterium]